MMRWKIWLFCVLFLAAYNTQADTFVNKKTGEQFEGYATKVVRGTKTAVRSAAREEIRYIESSEYDISYSPAGRRKQIHVLEINEPLLLECETQAFEKAIAASENQGPLAIAIKIDTPGGRIDLMKQYCKAIASVDVTPVIGVVCGGKNGGAYSAGAIIAMGCDKLYMEENSAMGAATLVVMDVNDGLKSARSKFGDDIGEKLDSAHRAYCASVAERAGRSGLVAQAMVDRQFEVLAVKTEEGDFKICDGRELKDRAGKEFVIVNPRGSLLTLSSKRAVEIGFADGRIDNFEQLKQQEQFAGCKFIARPEIRTARRQYEQYDKQFQTAFRTIMQLEDKIMIAVAKNEQTGYSLRDKALTRQLRAEVRGNVGRMLDQFRLVASLKKKCEDLPVELNEVVLTIDQLKILYDELNEK